MLSGFSLLGEASTKPFNNYSVYSRISFKNQNHYIEPRLYTIEYSQLYCNWAEVKLKSVRLQSWFYSFNVLKRV